MYISEDDSEINQIILTHFLTKVLLNLCVILKQICVK